MFYILEMVEMEDIEEMEAADSDPYPEAVPENIDTVALACAG